MGIIMEPLINQINNSLKNININDITLIEIDESGSMSQSCSKVKNGLKSLIEKMEDDKIIVIISFNSNLNFKFAGTVKTAKDNLIWNNYFPGSMTKLHDAFIFSYNFFNQLENNNNINIKVWICITDGNDTASVSSSESWISALNNIRNLDILIQLYALGSDLYNKYFSYFDNGNEITTWTHDTSQEVFNVASNSAARYRTAREAGHSLNISRSMSQPTENERLKLDHNFIRNRGTLNFPSIPLTDTEKHAFLDFAKKGDFENVKNLILKNNDYINVQ